MRIHRGFQRRVEDFTCEQCGHFVSGDGYTNHCPQCLWSKHVDVNPGDRQAQCKGLMAPVGLRKRRGETALLHRCTRCGHSRPNRVSPSDSFDTLLRVSAEEHL